MRTGRPVDGQSRYPAAGLSRRPLAIAITVVVALAPWLVSCGRDSSHGADTTSERAAAGSDTSNNGADWCDSTEAARSVGVKEPDAAKSLHVRDSHHVIGVERTAVCVSDC